MFNNRDYTYTHLSASSASQVFTGRGNLHAININTTNAQPVYIYDGLSTSASTALIAGIVASAAVGHYEYDASVSKGLYITCGAGDYTITWTQG